MRLRKACDRLSARATERELRNQLREVRYRAVETSRRPLGF
jgi:hypothetical protein